MLVAEIWDAPNSSLSFAKMLSVVAGFAVNESDGKEDAQGREAFLAKAKATFLDEDEEGVCVSSDKELKHAFLQVLAALPVRKPLRITVTFPTAEKPSLPAAAGIPKEIQMIKIEPTMKPFVGSDRYLSI